MNVRKRNGLNQNVLENVHPQHIALLKAHKSLRKSGVRAKKSESKNISRIRGQGQKIYECSRKCSPTANCIAEDSQKFAKMFMIKYSTNVRGSVCWYKMVCTQKKVKMYCTIIESSRKCSPTAYCIAEDPQKFAKMFMIE
jgi:hypothetical protein